MCNIIYYPLRITTPTEPHPGFNDVPMLHHDSRKSLICGVFASRLVIPLRMQDSDGFTSVIFIMVS